MENDEVSLLSKTCAGWRYDGSNLPSIPDNLTGRITMKLTCYRNAWFTAGKIQYSREMHLTSLVVANRDTQIIS